MSMASIVEEKVIKGTISAEQAVRGKLRDVPYLDNTLTKEGYSADAKAVGDALDKKAVGKAYLASNTDLNTVTTSGMYRLGGSLVNAPSGASYGQLLVIHGGGDSIAQIAFDFTMARMWVRTGAPADVGGAGTWTDWVQCYTTAKKPTASDVGAAPSGYGLGESQARVASTGDNGNYDADTIRSSGVYRAKAGTPNGNWWTILHIAHTADYAIQYGFAYQGLADVTTGTVVQRVFYNGTWQSWEYINPPMTTGVEYRTTKRYKDSAVYEKVDTNGNILWRKDGESQWHLLTSSDYVATATVE